MSSTDTLIEWQNYLQSSAQGIWEDSSQHDIQTTRLHSFGGEEDLNPIFFDPIFIDVSGDTIVVADRANDTVVCFDSTGALLWKYGGAGEGPGFLLGIGSLNIGDSLISVINSGFGYVDLITRDGCFSRRLTSVNAPQNAVFLNNDVIAVFSKQHPGGDVHLVRIESDSITSSFGNGNWESQYASFRSIWDIWATFIGSEYLVYVSQYENKLIVCNTFDGTSSCYSARNLPYTLTVTNNTVDHETRSIYSSYYPVFSAVFQGPQGEICVVLNNIMSDGRMSGSTDVQSQAPVTCVDRYSPSGEYLASFCFPDSGIGKVATNGNGYYVATQRYTGLVFGYRLEI
jgi:hypothetical protein